MAGDKTRKDDEKLTRREMLAKVKGWSLVLLTGAAGKTVVGTAAVGLASQGCTIEYSDGYSDSYSDGYANYADYSDGYSVYSDAYANYGDYGDSYANYNDYGDGYANYGDYGDA